MKIIAKLAAALMCVCIACNSCGCLRGSGPAYVKNNGSDSAMAAALGDSTTSIILDAGNVTAVNSSSGLPEKGVRQLRLSSEAVGILQFMLEDPANYTTNSVVFGTFNPSVTYIFKAHRKEIKVACDFGLGKFAVVAADGQQLAIYDLRNRDMLRFALTLYPDDKLLQAISKNK